MATDLKTAVLAYLDRRPWWRRGLDAAERRRAGRPYDAPVFGQRVDEQTGGRTVHYVSGRPAVTAVTLELLDAASGYVAPDGMGWDGQCLTMPGDLRYRPIGLDGQFVICRKVGP